METHIKEISNRLISSGVEVQIFTTDPSLKFPTQMTIGKIDVFQFRSYALNNMYFFSPQLYLALKKLKEVDIVHAHGYNTFPVLAAVLAKKRNKKALVFTPHYGGYSTHVVGTSYIRTIAKRCYNYCLGRHIFHHVDAIVSVGNAEREFLAHYFGLNQEKISYIPNGVEIKKWSRKRRTEQTRTLLYVGRIEKYKGVEALAKAFSRITESFPDSRLVFVGSGSYKDTLKLLVHRLKLADRVYFFENITDQELKEVYQTSDIFLTLPQHETFGISTTEAMAYGLPVIATRVGELSRIITHGKTGFLLDFPPNETAVARIIKTLLKNSELSYQVGSNARKEVLSKFSWRRSVQDIIGLYERTSQETVS